MTQNALTAAAATVTLTARQQAGIDSAIAASRSTATLRAYTSAFGRWTTWAAENGFDGLPASPEAVAAYLVSLADAGKSIATVRQASAAIAHAHRSAGLDSPTNSEGLKRVIAGLARTAAAAGKTSRQACGLTSAAVERIAAIASAAASTAAAAARAARDIALIRTMSDAMLRRSEASAVRWADLATEPDGSARLTVRRSKSDQEGRGAVLYIGIETAKAIAAIRPDAPDQDAPIFGLSPSQIHRVIRKRAAAAGIEDASSHGLRVGTAQDLAVAGAGTAAIQQNGRWADPKMVSRYTAAIAAGQSAVARYRYGR